MNKSIYNRGKPKVMLLVPFEAMQARLRVVPDLHPARYETTGAFPNEEELAALQAGATGL